MATSRITRHFATIQDGRWGARQVHYRRTGKGPCSSCCTSRRCPRAT